MIIHFKLRAKIQILPLGSRSRISQKYANGSSSMNIYIYMLFLAFSFRVCNPIFSYDNTTKNVSEEKIRGITNDNKLTFKCRLKNICKKANRKFNALVRITNFTSLFQKNTLLNSFIKFQFSYYPLTLVFSSWGLSKK